MHTPATSVKGKPIVCHQKGFNNSSPRLRQPESRAHGQADHCSVCKETVVPQFHCLEHGGSVRVRLMEWCEGKLIRQDRLQCCIQ